MNNNNNLMDVIKQVVIDGNQEETVNQVKTALSNGVDPLKILNEGLTPGAELVGKYFEEGTYFLPQLMLTGRALKAAMEIIVPIIKKQQADLLGGDTGIVVLATIQSDVHDIGKNLVSTMLSAGGFTVHDLGVDVPIETIINKAIEVDAVIIGCSALLTTSTPYLRDMINLLEVRGLRKRFKVVIGGASITPEYATSIGADGTAADAVGAVRLARKMVVAHKQEGN